MTDWLSDRCGLGDLAPLSRAVDDNQDTVTECRNLIRDVVWQSLKRDIEHVGYLDNLLTALLSAVRLDLFSLNHDRVLDRYFAERELGYSDGFGQVENGVRYWNPCVFDRSKQSTRLYKLHGSIDWFRLRPENGQLETERVGIPVNGDFWHTCASDGRHQTPVDGRPAFLAGTFNKVTDYTDDVFIELHHRFMSRLRHSRFLVVCGYGFGDKGINGRILSWLMGRPDRTMIVIDGDPTVRERARRAVQKVWDDLCRLGRIRLMTSWVQDLDAKALAQLIR